MSFSGAAAWGRAGAGGWAHEGPRPKDRIEKEGKRGRGWGRGEAFPGEEEPPPYSTRYRVFSALQRQILFHQGDVCNQLIKPPLLKQRVATSVIASLKGMKICALQAKRQADHRHLSPLSLCAGSDTIPVTFLRNHSAAPQWLTKRGSKNGQGHDCSSYHMG